MRSCSICEFLGRVTDSPEKEILIKALSKGGETLPNASNLLATAGLKASASLVGNHRRECDNTSKPSVKLDPNSLTVAPPDPKEEPSKPPIGWEPFAEYADSIGSAIVRLPTPQATARDLLITAGFDPSEWQISGKINTRRWMRYDQEWLYYYKFDVVAGESPEVVEEHVNELTKYIRRNKPKKTKFISDGTDAFVFAASDWQIGKAEGLDGTNQTIDRVLSSIEQAGNRVQELRRQGRKMPTLLFAGLGDLGEGTCGFYPGQQFLIDRNRRDQGRINRELITKALDHLSPMFEKTIVAAVGGNHGENRSLETKRLTDDADNDDCAYFEAVKEAFDRAGQTDIEWHIMNDELSMSLNVGGVSIGLTHGHLFQKGATAQQKAHEWWKGQDFGFQPVRGTKILLSAHFHHFSAISHGSRTHLQTPAMDPGSKWYRDFKGEDSPPGTLTFRLSSESNLGWEDLAILHP